MPCDRRKSDQIQVDSKHSGATGCLAMANVNTRAIERKLDRIRSLGLEEMRLEWRTLHHSDAPTISRDLLILGLGYRVQEIEQAGLGKAPCRKLQTMAEAVRTTGRVGATPSG